LNDEKEGGLKHCGRSIISKEPKLEFASAVFDFSIFDFNVFDFDVFDFNVEGVVWVDHDGPK